MRRVILLVYSVARPLGRSRMLRNVRKFLPRRRPKRTAFHTQSLTSSRPVTFIKDAMRSATSFSCPAFSANTSACAKVSMRPAFYIAATREHPIPGARKIDVKRGVRILMPADMRVSAA
jgi:hypothetical protein